MWVLYALGSAFCAALVTIFSKIGLKDINSHVATAIRTSVVLIMAWLLVFVVGKQSEINQISSRNWIFLILSGIATGFSWLFFFRGLQLGEASMVVAIDKFSVVFTMILAFIILKDTVTTKTIVGALLISGGIICMVV